MQSSCLKETSEVYSHGCCPNPFLGLPEPLKNVPESKSTSAAFRRSFVEITYSAIFPNIQFTDHESLPSLPESFAEFTKAYPQYSNTNQVDQIRAKDYYHFSLSNYTCLDYIGIGLFSYSQLLNHEYSKIQMASTSSSSLPPPKPSRYSDIPLFSISYKTGGSLKTQLLHGCPESELEYAMKKRIMSFLNISENDYSMVFTANRTSAFKLLAESYPFQSSRKLLTVYDYQSEAIEAMINCSKGKGARVMSAEFSWPRLRIHSAKLRKMIVSKRKKKKKRGLFVFPLHSRVTGAKYPYLWMSIAQENGWHILIDACALGPKDMDSFGLSLFRPDFLICSFYKVFGENPSGFGCLIVKKSNIPVLEDSASAGIVSLVPAANLFQLPDGSSGDFEQKAKFELQEDESATSNSSSGPIIVTATQPQILEQGETSGIRIVENTAKPNESETTKISESGKSADLPQQRKAKTNVKGRLEIECKGLDQADSLGLIMISSRTRCLINWLVNALMKLKHPNTEGISLIRIYGPKIKFDRGPALAFNIFDWKGEKVEPVLVQKLADRNNISLGYGFLQHIWFPDKYQVEKERVRLKIVSEGKDMAGIKKKEKSDMRITVVTAALGFLTNFEDTYRLWIFIAQFLDADFIEKERWRYTALNQNTIEV
ncbi:Aminotran_5 domain-containing protein [Cephalotus follicularis]|uniref:Aminotran_5 domain-containing protein n=1 Tax=Cephalotus follicularis TaxID=3775 RepID=A0A1Q3B1Y5_CEPFO|nr:Aminotran_5 domain-containing protein [Cephalotus follicularis]